MVKKCITATIKMALDLIKISRLSVEMGMGIKLTAASELLVILP